MAGAIQLTEVDFDQIKANLVNYLKSTKQFTDYDFSGSNLQVILNLLAYQAQMNAYTANMVANESFLASASVRDNVVSNARMLGYLPTSARSATSNVTFEFALSPGEYPNGFPQYLELRAGMAFTSGAAGTSNIFNVIDTQAAPVSSNGIAKFMAVPVYEGTYLPAHFVVDKGNFNQKFVLKNANIDSSTIRVEIQEDPATDVNHFYNQADNLVKLTSESRVYWLEEVDNGYYQLTFGDNYFGKALLNGAKIYVNYVVTDGDAGNGIQGTNNFIFVGKAYDSDGNAVTVNATVTEATTSSGGAQIESVPSVKFRAPKSYGAQNRAVVASDYDSLIRTIYPAVEDIYVYGGDTLNPPQYGRVFISVKPLTGESLSNVTKKFIRSSLDQYRVASLDLVFVDPEVIYVEAKSLVYYNDLKTLKDNTGIVSSVKETLSQYAMASSISKFGGAVRYSKIVGAIDGADSSITRNVTNLLLRKDVTALLNAPATYEICFDNALKLDRVQPVVSSTGFTLKIDGVEDKRTYYMEDDTKGVVYTYYYDNENNKVIGNKLFGTVDYETGEIKLGYIKGQDITVVTTVIPNGIIRIKVVPRDNDIIAKNSVFMDFDVDNSDIEAIVDTKISGS